MMLDWNQYREQLLKAIGDLARLSPQTVRGYRELRDAGTKTARVDAKTRELIALAVGVTRQCDGCITTHVHAARKQGATAEEIAEALGVAIAVNAGAALVYSARVMDAFAAGAEHFTSGGIRDPGAGHLRPRRQRVWSGANAARDFTRLDTSRHQRIRNQ
jgi:AhpD family alkylhydroperoxidase